MHKPERVDGITEDVERAVLRAFPMCSGCARPAITVALNGVMPAPMDIHDGALLPLCISCALRWSRDRVVMQRARRILRLNSRE